MQILELWSMFYYDSFEREIQWCYSFFSIFSFFRRKTVFSTESCDLDLQCDLDLEKRKSCSVVFHMSPISFICDYLLLSCIFYLLSIMLVFWFCRWPAKLGEFPEWWKKFFLVRLFFAYMCIPPWKLRVLCYFQSQQFKGCLPDRP